MRFLIPSYGRCGDVLTVAMLRRYGVPDEAVTIAVQTEGDYASYRAAYPGIGVIYAPKRNAAGNRNTLLATLRDGERAVLMDDDLIRVSRVVVRDGKASLVPETPEGFRKVIERGFSVAGNGIWGIQHTTNRIVLKSALQGGEVMRNQLVEGAFMGVTGGFVRFDEEIGFSEDYEACLHAIAGGIDTFRLKTHATIKRKNGKASGGCCEVYARGKEWMHEEMDRMIVSRYRGLVWFSNRRKDCIALRVMVRV